ncbi:MAG: universal stress protein [Micropepsaceae bacterium]
MTAIKSILVHADRSTASERRVGLAAALAESFGAKLTGAAGGVPYIPAYAPFGESFVTLQPEIIEAAQKQVAAALATAEAGFHKASGAGAAWRQSTVAGSATLLATLARSADLIVCGPPAAGEGDSVIGMEVSDLVMAAGRPVLVTPAAMERLSGKSIVVGWKDTRESRRAVADAMPFLLRAGEAVVAAVGADDESRGAQDVAAWLNTHGVNAKAMTESGSDADAAKSLAAIAARVGADLIVAGAFGHSRTREWIFGGVTRTLLTRGTTAVLFSH